MAELGATVVAFLSLAGVIRPLCEVVSSLREAPQEAIFFRNRLASLQSVVVALERQRERIPADTFSKYLRDSLCNVQEPLEQDVAALKRQLARLGSSQSSLRGRISWSWKSGELKQLCGRLDEYQQLLTTLLVLLHGEYLPLHHDLLTRTYSATSNLEQMTASIHETLHPRSDPSPISRQSSHYAVRGSEIQVNSFASQLQTSLQSFSQQQKTHNDNINKQVAMLANVIAGVASNDTLYLECRRGCRKMRHKSVIRFQYYFYFGTVIMSWGPLRRKRKRSLSAEDISNDEAVRGQPPPGFAASVEIVPASWLSQRAVVGGWSLIRDQRGSSSLYPHLSFLVTVPDDANVMCHAAQDDLPGLRDLFVSGKASVTDRTGAGWTPLHIAAAAGRIDGCKYLLAHGADVTSAGHLGLLPLHLAAAYGHLDVIKILVDNGGDPEAYNQHGFNAFFEVLHSPFISDPVHKAAIVIWLLQQEHFIVDVNGQDYQGNSILGWFVRHYQGGVKLLLDHNAEVNMQAYDGSTPLHKAAASGSLESVQLLISNGADLSIIENDGSTALVRAAERGCFNIVQQLTLHPLEPSFGGENPLVGIAYRPIQLLCEQGMPGPSEVVNQIIKTCSSSKATKQLRNSEIWHAAQQGYWSVVSKLQEAGVDPYRKNEYGYRALVRLVYKEDLQRLNELIQSGEKSTQIDDDLVLSLTRAAARGHADVVSHLLSLRTPEFFNNALGSKALVAAARHGHLDVIEILLGLVPQYRWYRALVRGAENGHLEVVKHFLNCGVHPTRSSVGGDTAIVRAARYGHLEVVKLLLEAGADPNQHGWFGYSALVRAAYNNHFEVVDCLLTAGAIPDLPETEGDCAMVRSVRQGHGRIVERLRLAGAQPIHDDGHEKKNGPSKALMKAAIYSNERTLVQLLCEGANPNTVEVDGNTPISRACENGHLNIVNLLLEYGAQPHALSTKAVSPLERAAEGGYLDIVKALLKAYQVIPVAEKRKAILKASEKDHADIAACLVENGVDLQNSQLPMGSAGLLHFYILDHWMESVMGDGKRPAFQMKPLHTVKRGVTTYPVGPPTWGYDGSLVARFRFPFQILFYSDLTSSNMRNFCSSILLKLAHVLRVARRYAILLSALVALFVGLGILGVHSVVRPVIRDSSLEY